MHLQGKKIFLRSVLPSDAAVLYEWENDKENRSEGLLSEQAGSANKPYTKKEIESFISRQKDIYLDKQLRLMICLPPAGKTKEDRPVGCIDLFDYRDHLGSAGVGVLVSKKFRKKGHASEALFLLIRYSFDILNLLELNCTVAKDNIPSMKLFTSNKFLIVKEKTTDTHMLLLKNF